MRCPKCNTEAGAGDALCLECGTHLIRLVEEVPPGPPVTIGPPTGVRPDEYTPAAVPALPKRGSGPLPRPGTPPRATATMPRRTLTRSDGKTPPRVDAAGALRRALTPVLGASQTVRPPQLTPLTPKLRPDPELRSPPPTFDDDSLTPAPGRPTTPLPPTTPPPLPSSPRPISEPLPPAARPGPSPVSERPTRNGLPATSARRISEPLPPAAVIAEGVDLEDLDGPPPPSAVADAEADFLAIEWSPVGALPTEETTVPGRGRGRTPLEPTRRRCPSCGTWGPGDESRCRSCGHRF